jgi:hypothetical protein
MSGGTSKPIRLSAHARGYLARRGFSQAEVEEAIRTAVWRAARGGRMEAAKEFPYNDVWNGTYYTTKRVRPVFVETPTEIIVITVYTYFF